MILLNNRIRVKTDTGGGYAFDPENDPNGDRFRFNTGGIQSVAVSKANNDGGMFNPPPGNPDNNISNGALGIFVVAPVVSEEVIIK